MSRIRLIVLILLLAFPGASLAEGVRLNFLVGYGFGGEVWDSFTRTTASFDDDMTYGFALDIPLPAGSYLEILWRRQESGLTASGSFQPVLFDMDIDLYQVGGLYEFEDDDVRPFVVGSLGASRFTPEPSNLSSETRFSMTLGGGVGLYPTEHLGFRLEGRAIAHFVGSSGGGIGCGTGGCWVWGSSEVLWQGEFTGGLVLSF